MPMPRQTPGRSKQDYSTPDDFIKAAKRFLRIRSFSHDFAADRFNTKAATFFTKAQDALAQKWAPLCSGPDEWGWLNPPFDHIGFWAQKCWMTKQAGGSLAFLVPASVGSNWFRDHVHKKAMVYFLNGRIHFDPLNPTWGYPKDCLLILYSPRVEPGYDVWTWK